MGRSDPDSRTSTSRPSVVATGGAAGTSAASSTEVFATVGGSGGLSSAATRWLGNVTAEVTDDGRDSGAADAGGGVDGGIAGDSGRTTARWADVGAAFWAVCVGVTGISGADRGANGNSVSDGAIA